MRNPHDIAIVHPAAVPIRGTITVGPDKSITHRALFFGALNHGTTIIRNPSHGADPIATMEMVRSLGRSVIAEPMGWRIDGSRDIDAMRTLTLDCRNSGTTARLAAGLLTGAQGTFTLTGDESLMRRPMARVADPLRLLGATIETDHGHLPMVVYGSGGIPGSLETSINVASAQVHAALLLAALRSESGALLHRTKGMRDHTLRMARYFGVRIEEVGEGETGGDRIHPARIETGAEIGVPGDFSSAVFMIAAALLVPGSHLRIEHVGLNPTRTAFLAALKGMRGDVRWGIEGDDFEPAGWIEAAASSELRGITLGDGEHPEISVAEMIDELPLLALIATQAHGVTTVRDAAELRVKESDRIAATAALLRALGLEMTELEDGFTITGPQPIAGGGRIDHHGDHRLCMTAAIGALAARNPVEIPHPDAAGVSYPEFWDHLRAIGADWSMASTNGSD